jgi:hypothetical protein
MLGLPQSVTTLTVRCGTACKLLQVAYARLAHTYAAQQALQCRKSTAVQQSLTLSVRH